MFENLENQKYLLFAGLDFLWLSIVFVFYPETAACSLESIDVMRSSSSSLYSKMEAAYQTAGNGEVLALQEHTPNDGSKIDEFSAALEITP